MIQNTFKYGYAYVIIILSLFLATCHLDRIEPTEKYDPCLRIVTSLFTHDKVDKNCDSLCTVQFTNQSTGAKSFAWDFDDGGSTSTEVNPKYTFKKTGVHTVKLTATAENGCAKISSGTVNVTSPNTPDPVADFTFPSGMLFAPATVTFTSTSQNANEYAWSVNDVPFSTLNNPTYTFAQPGDYSIKLVAKSGLKVSNPKTQTVTIQRITFQNTLATFGIGKKIIATADGGFIVAGKQFETGSTTNTDVYIIKVDAFGKLVTTLNLPPINLSRADDVFDLVTLSTGAIAVIGTTLSSTGTKNILYASFDPTTFTWVSSPTIYGTTTSQVIGLGAVQSGLGNWLTICGASAPVGAQPDALLISRSFNQLISPNFNDIVYTVATSAEYFYDISTTSSGGYIAIGTSNASNSALNDVLLTVTNSTGTKLTGFPKTFGSAATLEEANAIFKTKLGKFLVGGTSRANISAAGDFWLLLTDETGNAASGFPVTLGDATANEESRDVMELSDGSIGIVGLRDNLALFYKTNASGQSPSAKTYGTGNQFFNALTETKDGGLIFVGGNGTSLYLVRKDKDGN